MQNKKLYVKLLRCEFWIKEVKFLIGGPKTTT